MNDFGRLGHVGKIRVVMKNDFAAAKSLSGESSRLRTEVGKFLTTVRAA